MGLGHIDRVDMGAWDREEEGRAGGGLEALRYSRTVGSTPYYAQYVV